MGLKLALEAVPFAGATQPAWGELAAEGETVGAIRFEAGQRSVSFPVHVVRRWELIPGRSEVLLIRADAELITVEGHGLSAVRDALEQGRLRILRVAASRTVGAGLSSITVASIRLGEDDPPGKS